MSGLDPAPLIVISHGNGHDFRWYDYLGRHLASWGYSSLDQISRSNVERLSIAWSVTMEPGPNEAGPLVRDGVLYLPNSGDVIQALDATTGEELWKASLGGQIVMAPVTYMVNGKQYVSVISGHVLVTFGLPD